MHGRMDEWRMEGQSLQDKRAKGKRVRLLTRGVLEEGPAYAELSHAKGSH